MKAGAGKVPRGPDRLGLRDDADANELLHVTLSTGDIRTSPLVDGYRLTASETGELLAFEIWPRPELDSLPLVRCTVARPGKGGAAAWLGDAERCVAWCWLLRERLPA